MPDKYQDEIEEILRMAGEVAPSEPPKELERASDEGPRPVRAARRIQLSSFKDNLRRPRLSPGKLLLAGLVIFLVAAWMGWTLFIWLGLGLLVVAYLLFFVTPRSISNEKRWRGRSVEDYQSPLERLKRWFRSG